MNGKITIALAAAGAVLLLIFMAEQRQRLAELRLENQNLRAERNKLLAENQAATASVRQLQQDLETLQREIDDVPRLRGELTAARQRGGAANAPNATSGKSAGSYISKDQLADVGYDTPEAALQTFKFALVTGNYDKALESGPQTEPGSPEDRAKFEEALKKMPPFLGMQVIARKVVSDDRVDLETIDYVEGAAPQILIEHMVKVGDGWRSQGGHTVDSEWERGAYIDPVPPQ